MSSDIKGKVGWLKDENGEIFIPKTLTSAIQNAEGTNLDNLLKNLSPSPGGSGGGSYSETVLYDYREDNGGVICYDTTTQTLRDDVEN